MKGKHVLGSWCAGALLASGVWSSVMFPEPYTIIPTVFIGVLTITAFVLWVVTY